MVRLSMAGALALLAVAGVASARGETEPEAPRRSLRSVYELWQADFAQGSVVISEPGTYRLMENVTFRPEGDLDPSRPEMWMYPDMGVFGPSFKLGFFAALVVGANDVTIDLNGFTLEQSEEHALMQRFFSLIELANSPFPPAKGPAQFLAPGDAYVAARRVVVKNGRLGRSSHHGIHGNDNRDVELKNLVVTDFEVAGISLNNPRVVSIKNVEVRDSRADVPANGRLSQAIFLLQAVGARLSLDAAGLPAEAAAVGDAMTALRAALTSFLNDPTPAGDTQGLFASTTNGVPDASMVAGIVLHPKVHVGGFLEHAPDGDARRSNVDLKNVVISNLRVSPGEIGALQSGSPAVQVHDVVGAIFDLDKAEVGGAYDANVLADLQLRLAEYALACLDESSTCASRDGGRQQELLARNSISQDVVAFASGNITFSELLDRGYSVAPNHDVMFHQCKGVIGIKMDGLKGVYAKNVEISELTNLADESRRSRLVLADPGHAPYMKGFAARGVSVSGSANIQGEKIRLESIAAAVGPSMCIDLQNELRKVEFSRVFQTVA